MENKKIIAVAVLALALIHISFAYTAYDAETFYKSSLTYFKYNDFRNTLRSVHLAKDIFTTLNDQDGVVKCDQLITQVDEILTDSQMASAYYDIAGEYFLQEDATITSYTYAKTFAQLAKEFYNRAGDGQGVLRCEDLITRSQSEINNMQSEKQQQAYSFYKQAESSFLTDDYVTARLYAFNASLLYGEILDQGGVSQTAILISRIEGKINETRFNAIATYDRARDYYVEKDYESAIKYASISQELYLKIADKDGANQATDLLSKINSEYTQTTEQNLRLAQSYLDKARNMLIARDYVNATEYARRAREIYQTFYDKALEEEKDIPASGRVKTKLYLDYLNNVESLTASINAAWGSDKKKEQAEQFYIKAQEYYLQGQLDFAINYVERAKYYFSDLNDYLGVNKCDALTSSIKTRMDDKTQADNDYGKALSLYHVAEFENSLLYLNKAKAIYVRIIDKKGIENSENLTTMINNGIKVRSEAETYYQQASRFFNSGDYANAKSYSEKALQSYGQINHTLGVSSSMDIFTKSTEEIENAYTQFRNNALIGAAIILVGGYLIISKLREQKAVVKELNVEKKKMEEEDRIRTAEWSLKKDDETKEKVEDELRKLIDQERGGPATEEDPKPQAGSEKKESSVEDELRKLIEEERKQESKPPGK